MQRQIVGIRYTVYGVLALGVLTAMASAEPPSRSIFGQAKVVETKVEKPVKPSRKEILLQALGVGGLQIPETYGRVIDVYEGTSNKTIIHIQDAHVHYEAQKNIAGILESLIQRNHLKLILVEGGNLRGELSSLRKLASKESRQEVADRYLRKGLLAGDEYLELVSDYPMIRQGIEDPVLYEENLRIFMEVDRFKEKALGDVEALRRVVETLKRNMYRPAHLEFERKREEYRSEKIELVDYYQYLTSLKAPEGFPNIERLLAASRTEKEIDFNKVDEERSALLEALTAKLTPEEMNTLATRSLAYKEGALSQKDYYDAVKTLALQKEVAFTAYPNFDKYVSYLALYDAIQHSELFKEGDRLESQIRESLVGSEDERQLMSIGGQLELLSNLLQIKISPDDFAMYNERRLRFSVKTFLPFLEKKITEHRLAVSVPEEAAEIDQYLRTLDRFYQIAQKRDLVFVENALKEMEKENVAFAVLKTGGFHTPGLTRILKEKGISYVVISPRITEAGNPELYYSVLKEKSGLSPQ